MKTKHIILILALLGLLAFSFVGCPSNKENDKSMHDDEECNFMIDTDCDDENDENESLIKQETDKFLNFDEN